MEVAARTHAPQQTGSLFDYLGGALSVRAISVGTVVATVALALFEMPAQQLDNLLANLLLAFGHAAGLVKLSAASASRWRNRLATRSISARPAASNKPAAHFGLMVVLVRTRPWRRR